MTSFARTSLKTITRVFHRDRTPDADEPGIPAVLDGLSAIAAIEARVCDGAALGASFPASIAARAWSSMRRSQNARNAFDRPMSEINADDARGALSSAIGLALSGERAVTFLAGSDALVSTDLFTHAAGQGLPLLVHLSTGAATAHAQTLGSGHETYHALADTGCALLLAVNVQEAADATLIARRAAEASLIPFIVAMDTEPTALAAQDLRAPSEALLRDFLAGPADLIEPTSDAQRMAFGPNRRRVPRRHDLERPNLLAPLQGPESFAIGAASRSTYLANDADRAMSEAAAALATRTGRNWEPILEHRVSDARTVMVVQGAAIETAIAVTDFVRKTSGRKIGVIGIRCLRPLPVARIAQALKGKRTVAVLERLSPMHDGDGPLMREVLSVLARSHDAPTLVNAFYGHAGFPLRACDMLAFIDELESPQRDRCFIGLSFTEDSSQLPKRQALMDALRRNFPEAAVAGVRRHGPPADVRPDDATTIAIVHDPADRERALAGDLGVLLHTLVGGHVRARPALSWHRLDEPGVDIVSHSSAGVPESGDEPPIDMVISAIHASRTVAQLHDQIADDAAFVLVGDRVDADVSAKDWSWHRIPTDDTTDCDANDPRLTNEMLLGSIARLFLVRQGDAQPQSARACAARETMLEDVSEEERSARIEAFRHGFESLAPAKPRQGADASRHESDQPSIDAQDPSNTLATFWNRVAVLYGSHQTSALTPDPEAGAGAVPALSATLRDCGGRNIDGAMLVAFDPSTFDGRPDAWMRCPDGSVAPIVISPRAIIDAGIELAGAAGRPADALRAVAAKLARRACTTVSERETIPTTVGALFEEAGAAVIADMKAPDDRKSTMREALDNIIEQVGDLPIAATDLFFHEPERKSPGSGELLSVVVNPDACKDPQFIAAICEGRGMTLIERTPEAIARARRLWTLWKSLPDTSGETIQLACNDERFGTLAGALLSRHCLMAMSGGGGAEVASGQELALRHALALAEYHLQPRMQSLLADAESRGQDLGARIHETLGNVLPDSDLDLLAQGIDALGRKDLDLSSLSAQVDAAVVGGRVDGARLGRLVDVARGLADLRWRLLKGPEGLSRSRVGLTIGRSAVSHWAGVYPWNPFRSPATLDGCGEAAHLALGLLEGQLRQSVDGARLMRWADLELTQPERAPREMTTLATLTYADLSPQERRACPPMLLIGDGRTIAGGGLSQLMWLLSLPLPIKVLLLSDMSSAADVELSVDMLGPSRAGQRTDVALLAMFTRNAYVAQTSIGDPSHFAGSVLEALAFDGPALVNVYAPSPTRHGFPAARLFEQSRLAVQSRAVPLLRYDPAAGGVFGSCLDLSGNPSPESVFAAGERAETLTPVDWAASEQRFRPHLTAFAPDDPAPTPIGEFLEMNAADRAGRTPYIETNGDNPQRLRVDTVLVHDADDRVRLWRTLQELAGVVTPFTESVSNAAREEVEEDHRHQIEALEHEHEAQLAQMKHDYDDNAVRRVTERLMILAGYDSRNGGTGSANR